LWTATAWRNWRSTTRCRVDSQLVPALRILARDIYCEDGVATAVIAQAADVIDSLRAEVREQRREIAGLREERAMLLGADRTPGADATPA
jgi:hypothetical protein